MQIMNSTCDTFIHKLSLTLSLSDLSSAFSFSFSLMICNICIERILSELSFFLVYARHMRSAILIFKSFSQLVISFARFWVSMLSSFIDVSLCLVDAAHMHRRGFDNQMWIYLWSHLMLLTYASHMAWDFSNPTSDLGCAGHMPFLKFNPTSRIFFNPLSAAPRSCLGTNMILGSESAAYHGSSQFVLYFTERTKFVSMQVMPSCMQS